MKKFATALAVLAVGGCATIVRGTDEQVQFMSEPSGASVQTSIGLSCPITPCTIPIPRKHEFVATFHLPDHEPQNVAVATRLAGAELLASPATCYLAAWWGWRWMYPTVPPWITLPTQ